jgi:hypothetical protein
MSASQVEVPMMEANNPFAKSVQKKDTGVLRIETVNAVSSHLYSNSIDKTIFISTELWPWPQIRQAAPKALMSNTRVDVVTVRSKRMACWKVVSGICFLLLSQTQHVPVPERHRNRRTPVSKSRIPGVV